MPIVVLLVAIEVSNHPSKPEQASQEKGSQSVLKVCVWGGDYRHFFIPGKVFTVSWKLLLSKTKKA